MKQNALFFPSVLYRLLQGLYYYENLHQGLQGWKTLRSKNLLTRKTEKQTPPGGSALTP